MKCVCQHAGFPESQNHSMTEARRDLWFHLFQPLLKQRLLECDTYVHVQAAFNGGEPTASLGNLCQCSVTHTAEKCFLMVRGNLLTSYAHCFLSWALRTPGNNLAPYSLNTLFKCLLILIRSPQASFFFFFFFSWAEQSHLSQLFFSYKSHSNPLTTLTILMTLHLTPLSMSVSL